MMDDLDDDDDILFDDFAAMAHAKHKGVKGGITKLDKDLDLTNEVLFDDRKPDKMTMDELANNFDTENSYRQQTNDVDDEYDYMQR